MQELWKLSASDITRHIQSNEITSLEVIQSTLDRIASTNPAINSCIDVLVEDALRAARALDLRPDKHHLPLAGVPVTVKDTINVQGQPVTRGTKAFGTNTSAQNSPIVNNLQQSGAIIVGRTNTSTIGMRWFTENTAYGTTRNPHDLNLSPMGSSGGAAASVATGQCALAHGSDSWGSIRLPAWACGVVGFKPTVGTVPNHTLNAGEQEPLPRPYLTQLCTTDGIMCRSVADGEMAFGIMRQNGYCDPAWTPVTNQPPYKQYFRIAVADYGSELCSAGTQQALIKVCNWLADYGHTVEHITIPNSKQIAQTYAQATFGLFTGYESLFHSVVINDPQTLQVIGWYQEILDRYGTMDCRSVLHQRHKYQMGMAQLFGGYDLLITPVCLNDQYAIQADCESLDKLQKIVESFETQALTSFLNLPSMSLPVMMYNNLPASVQLVSAPHCESRIFQVARHIETCAKYSGWDNLQV